MEHSSPHIERRKYHRYQVPDLIIAVPQKSDSHVARIVNISKGGMAVRYIDQNDWLGEAEEIDILSNSNFFVNRIPVKTIRDIKVKNHVSFSILKERQCCLQFGPLTPAQESLLDEFVMIYSAGNS